MSAPTGGGALAGDGALAASVAGNLARLRARIASAGDPAAVRIVAVTKTFPLAAVFAARAAGLADIGENYANELVDKAAAAGAAGASELRWHFLGELQRNKLARLAPLVACYQGLDRLEEGEGLARRRPGARVLVEVDVAGTPGRGGVAPREVTPLVGALVRLELDVAGLMTVAPPDPVAARRAFSLVAALRAELGLAEASMGMSDDLELAVEAGSTMVRVGSALFGPRAGQGPVPQ
ncbi:MAG TPA: alanine racemase [Acidimicrobiales bacterium]|nr:alanine racemase [Acidimicrobiales bacterium]